MSGFLVEVALPVSVDRAWAALVEMLGPELGAVGGERRITIDDWAFVERTTVLAPPSRRAYEIVGAPPSRYEGVTDLVADGDGCVLRWRTTVTVDDQTAASFLARAEESVRRALDALARELSD
jgi:hypothetical protein